MTLARSWPRVAAPAILAAALACFLLPWLTVTADERRADATGIEQVTRDPDVAGRYVHVAWQGEVERVVDAGELWALPAFVAVAFALVLVLLPWRAAWSAALGAAAAGAILLFLWVQATTSAFRPPIPDRHWGIWLALVLVPLAAVPILARLVSPAAASSPAPEWLGAPRRDP